MFVRLLSVKEVTIRTNKKLVSVIIPMYNEMANVEVIYQALSEVTKTLSLYAFEFIFVNDGSTDETSSLLARLYRKDLRVRVMEFSRNFGKEAAVSAGLHSAEGDAAIILDSDLQHPPQLMGEFLEKWEAGAEVVVGVREYSGKEDWLKRYSSNLYYRILRTISPHSIIMPHATDFRLLDRCVIDAFNEFTERNRMTRGLIDWLGFRRDYVYFVSPPRQHGEASYSYRKLMGLAVNSMTAYSMFPLRLAGYLGVFILSLSALSGLFVVAEKYMLQDPLNLRITGTAVLAIALLFLVGIVLACLGLISLYIAQIHAETINRPLYMLRRRQWLQNQRQLDVNEEGLLSKVSRSAHKNFILPNVADDRG